MKIFGKVFGLFDVLIIALLSCIFCYFTFSIDTDIPLHVVFIKNYAFGNNTFPVNFLYYFTVYALSGFSYKIPVLLKLSVITLTGATFAKYYIVKRIFNNNFNGFKNIATISSVLSAALIFSFSLPSIQVLKGYFFLLNYSPNVWHNSTTIFVMPFAVLLFWYTIKQINEFKYNRILLIILLLALNIIAKPSYVFAYVLALPLLLLFKYKLNKYFWLNILPIIVAGLLIFIEYFLIYKSDGQSDSSVVINYFSFINSADAGGDIQRIITILITSIFTSFLFPFVVILKNRQLVKQPMVQLALLSSFIGLIIGNVLAETGERANDGNFMWQNYICSFILFFTCVYQLLRLQKEYNTGWAKFKPEFICLGLQVVATIVYFIKVVLTGSYF